MKPKSLLIKEAFQQNTTMQVSQPAFDQEKNFFTKCLFMAGA